MRINAYILAADPAWIEASVLSYYDLVQKIVVSYDETRTSWTGTPIAVDECLERLHAIDHDHKMSYSPGHYARMDHHPMENDTYQRQCALDEASVDADWVLQFDTDEVLGDLKVFESCLQAAENQEHKGVHYPARWIYRQLGKGRYLESCTRFWGVTAGYPGPVAVKPGTLLRHARQCDVSLYRVDFKPKNTDLWHSKETPVHRVIRQSMGIFHFSMVRDEKQLRKKTEAWSHSKDRDWGPERRYWAWCGKYPYLAALKTPLLRRKPLNTHRSFLRICKITLPMHLRAHEIKENSDIIFA